jgi:SNF2 family DNA or RNA helicase
MSGKVAPKQKVAHILNRVNETKKPYKILYKAAKYNKRDKNTDSGQKKKNKDIPVSSRKQEGTAGDSETPLERIEFSRDRYILINHTATGQDVLACSHTGIYDETGDSLIYQPTPACECGTGFDCEHRKELEKIMDAALEGKHHRCDSSFQKSFWREMVSCLTGTSDLTPDAVLMTVTENASIELREPGTKKLICSYLGAGEPDIRRFRERFPSTPKESGYRNKRFMVLRRMADSFLTKADRIILNSGNITPRLIRERSFWMRLAYHMHWEFNELLNIEPVLSTNSPDLILVVRLSGKEISKITIPALVIGECLDIIRRHGLEGKQTPTEAVLASPSLRFRMEGDDTLIITPVLTILHPDGSTEKREIAFMPVLSPGRLALIDGIGLVEMPASEQKISLPFNKLTKLEGEQMLDFIVTHKDILAQSPVFDVTPEVLALKIYDMPKLELTPHRIERDCCEFTISYQAGESRISIYEILKLRKERKKYAKSANGWIKITDMKMDRAVESLGGIIGDGADGDSIKVSKINFLRMLAVAQDTFNIGAGVLSEQVRNIMELRPALVSPRLEGFSAILRHYQETGLHWLTFLAENNIGGLLCDDMGLGKTHQTLALMIAMKEEMAETRPFLVVCPTSVIGHWEDKITRFAPGLKAIPFHGTKREIEGKLLPGNVLLTSYGTARNDIEELAAIEFGLVVFDEIQCIKNKETLSYQAAARLKRRMALGLSGTPIENSLRDLKALLDLTLPGYLGDDKAFERDYMDPCASPLAEKKLCYLRKVVSPFTLRRLKSSVLTELPPKIEDTRRCALSQEQAKLYQEALDIKAGTIRKELLEPGGEIPFIHIFALLDLLKQICDHPAIVEGKPENYPSRSSGKWELFTEILGEALGSGQKAVVFSQYLDMVEIIRLHLCGMGVGHVVLTGSTTDRTKIIREFNSNPECQVFVGSLKAGGMGIDLVAASVVIHYDRWWNSAREEQATDRVHRIGQTRGVQVFKFITDGTLEERIDSIITRKKSLLHGIVSEDNAGVLKSLTRKDFLELLQAPRPKQA